MSFLCHEIGEDCERRHRDLERVPSVPLKFPANQAGAYGPLLPDRQPHLRQKVSWHTGRPLSGSFQGLIASFGLQDMMGPSCPQTCPALPGWCARAVGTEARS